MKNEKTDIGGCYSSEYNLCFVIMHHGSTLGKRRAVEPDYAIRQRPYR
jgi:hypothetical protein